jgi:cytoskeletal protein CcmA (bactofilin family)
MNKIETPLKISGFIDRDSEIIGDIKFKENFRIDGVFKGKILSGNGLIIGETGEIEADIDVVSIAINGRVKGSIKAKERIEIFSKGRVIGSVTAPKLIIEDGAFFQGSCQMEMKALDSKTRDSEAKIVK